MRILPPVYKVRKSADQTFGLTLKERFLLIIGYRIRVLFTAKCRYNTGPWEPELHIRIVETNPTRLETDSHKAR